MLQVQFIREHKDEVLEGLKKRNISNAEEMIERVLSTDEVRRKSQVELDNVSAESNKLSKEIGLLFKSGEVRKATLVREKTSQLKEQKETLSKQKITAEETLQQLLFQIPNIPHQTVPYCQSHEDNE